MLTALPSQPHFVSSGSFRMRCSSQMPLTGRPSGTVPASSDIQSTLLPCPGALLENQTELEHHKEAYVPRGLGVSTIQAPNESRADCTGDSCSESGPVMMTGCAHCNKVLNGIA